MEFDVIKEILEKSLKANPANEFIVSLNKFYDDRGGLSKKQMEGLHKYAQKIDDIHPGKLATLEAIIKKRPTWQKKENNPLFKEDEKDPAVLKDMDEILSLYPQHKRVLFLKEKYIKNETLSLAELDEIKRFKKILIK